VLQGGASFVTPHVYDPSPLHVSLLRPLIWLVPDTYHDLAELFGKEKVLSLSPHQPYDCAINLLIISPIQNKSPLKNTFRLSSSWHNLTLFLSFVDKLFFFFIYKKNPVHWDLVYTTTAKLDLWNPKWCPDFLQVRPTKCLSLCQNPGRRQVENCLYYSVWPLWVPHHAYWFKKSPSSIPSAHQRLCSFI